jgi:glycine/D-amino acid oxidase-like deaminating enzyme
MNLSSGYPFSLIRNGIPDDYPKLVKDTHADVVVLGGGISGALTSFCLHEAGIDNLVVDGRTIGMGSTCASTSLLQYELDTPLHKLQDLIGIPAARRAYGLCADSIEELARISGKTGAGSFSRVQSLYYAASEKDIPFLLAELDARSQMGLKVTWMDREWMLDTYGIVAPAALLSEPAAQTDAYMLTHALHRYNVAKGVPVYDRTYIDSIEATRKGVKLLTKEGYTIRCRKLVYATGYEAVRYIPEKMVRLSSTYAVASEQMNDVNKLLENKFLLWSTADPYFYARATGDNRLIIGGRDEDFFSPGKRDALIKRKRQLLVKDIGKLMPGVEFIPEFSWTGTFGSTKDSLPYIGVYPGKPNCLFALGFGGNGITFSLVAARIVTDLIKGRKNKNAALFGFDR